MNIWQVPPNTLWILPALREQLTKVFGADEVKTGRLAYFFSKASVLPQASFEALERFYGNGIDPGEQLMLGVLLDHPDVEHLITGDRNALRQVGLLCHSDPSMRQRLDDTSIWCFESVLAHIIRRRGFEVVRRNVHRWIATKNEVDIAIGTIFHPSCQATDVADGLESRIAVLRTSSSGLAIKS